MFFLWRGFIICFLFREEPRLPAELPMTPRARLDHLPPELQRAARWVFLGTRSAFGIAYQMRYAFQMLRSNGLLLDGLGGMTAEEADLLQEGDALVVISQAPYPTACVRLARQASSEV
ncbi:hypothetical protein BTL50_15230 [Bordetella holmesii]|uniref:SIS domain protein n=1 Tax=Bordetella holmesii 1058 TaxID=1247648 RepID=A0ABN0S113_9BORD|nr:SIS domain protein [Bordetella holmesii 44057]AMD44600.1 hypothetical protein H558_03235 [Bordetella holmesii H558]AMD50670.1 hypothetical protein F783_014855 [Bordetella holmesii F627]AOB36703.1 hypothetical protein BBB42_15040 [Bordetella holmesii]EWM48167.1 SIS domain protein [Bordetella holmesii 41130]EWM50100.1 SIS domain protein [Bordetella holmesii 35009]EXX95241.1 SIS domain protein [Bordetella holmesii 1058]KAK85682.1 SIS domain protein [Bordetella holmesii CDC-H572-BH]KCV06472.